MMSEADRQHRDEAAHAPGHAHDFLGSRHDENARRTLWVVALTTVMMVAEIAAGLAFGSMALLADGFHMATHAGVLAVSAAAYSYARRHSASPRFSFGTGKVGDLAGFASALTLGLVAIGIGWESAVRLFEPRTVAFDQAIVVAVVGLAVNIVSALMLGGGDHHHHGDEHDHHHGRDNNLRAAYFHVLADALTSVLAIVALVAGRTLGWVWLDPAMGVVGAIVIARWSWNLMWVTGAVLLDATDATLERQVRERVEQGDVRIVDLHVWRVGPEACAAIVSVTGSADPDLIRERLKPLHALAHVTVERR
jgi:cation diffusion facilitator family transporter